MFASVVLLTQPSVKVALGYSSAAHMGFMLMVCGLGMYPAAILHLVAHSFYKAHAFLSSGSVIDRPVPRPWRCPDDSATPAAHRQRRAALAMYLPLAPSGASTGGDPLLVAIGAILVIGVTQLLAPALDSAGTAAGSLRAAGLALAVTVSFFALEGGTHAAHRPSRSTSPEPACT